jgi:hypothetical protein
MKSLANHNSDLITYLRQEIIEERDGIKVRLYLQDNECFPELK